MLKNIFPSLSPTHKPIELLSGGTTWSYHPWNQSQTRLCSSMFPWPDATSSSWHYSWEQEASSNKGRCYYIGERCFISEMLSLPFSQLDPMLSPPSNTPSGPIRGPAIHGWNHLQLPRSMRKHLWWSTDAVQGRKATNKTKHIGGVHLPGWFIAPWDPMSQL